VRADAVQSLAVTTSQMPQSYSERGFYYIVRSYLCCNLAVLPPKVYFRSK